MIIHIICKHDKFLEYSFLKTKYKKNYFMSNILLLKRPKKKMIFLKVLSQLHSDLFILDFVIFTFFDF